MLKLDILFRDTQQWQPLSNKLKTILGGGEFCNVDNLFWKLICRPPTQKLATSLPWKAKLYSKNTITATNYKFPQQHGQTDSITKLQHCNKQQLDIVAVSRKLSRAPRTIYFDVDSNFYLYYCKVRMCHCVYCNSLLLVKK